jgi:hypothetical protein
MLTAPGLRDPRELTILCADLVWCPNLPVSALSLHVAGILATALDSEANDLALRVAPD